MAEIVGRRLGHPPYIELFMTRPDGKIPVALGPSFISPIRSMSVSRSGDLLGLVTDKWELDPVIVDPDPGMSDPGIIIRSPEGNFIVYGGTSDPINRSRVYILISGIYVEFPYFEPPASPTYITAGSFNGDGSLLALTYSDSPGSVEIYQVLPWGFVHLTTLGGEGGAVESIDFSGTEVSRIRVTYSSGDPKLWIHEGGELVELPHLTLAGAFGGSESGEFFLKLPFEGHYEVWRLSSAGLHKMAELPEVSPANGVANVTFTPDGRHLIFFHAITGSDGAHRKQRPVTIYSLSTGFNTAFEPNMKLRVFSTVQGWVSNYHWGNFTIAADGKSMWHTSGARRVVIEGGLVRYHYVRWIDKYSFPDEGVPVIATQIAENVAVGASSGVFGNPYLMSAVSPDGGYAHFQHNPDSTSGLTYSESGQEIIFPGVLPSITSQHVTNVAYGPNGEVSFDHHPTTGGTQRYNYWSDGMGGYVDTDIFEGTVFVVLSLENGVFRTLDYFLHPGNVEISDVVFSRNDRRVAYHLFGNPSENGRNVFQISNKLNRRGVETGPGETDSRLAFDPLHQFFAVSSNRGGTGDRLSLFKFLGGGGQYELAHDLPELFGPVAFSNCGDVVVASGLGGTFAHYVVVDDMLVDQGPIHLNYTFGGPILSVQFLEDCDRMVIITEEEVVLAKRSDDPEQTGSFEFVDAVEGGGFIGESVHVRPIEDETSEGDIEQIPPGPEGEGGGGGGGEPGDRGIIITEDGLVSFLYDPVSAINVTFYP